MTMKLRRWQEDDLERLVKIADNKNIADNLTNKFPHPYTEESGRGFIQFANANTPPFIMAIEIDGLLAGGVGLHPLQDIFCKNSELGYWLAEEYWGKGFMTKAVIEITKYGFSNFDIDRIFARPFGNNIGSQRVLQKAGFKLEAKFEKTLFKNGNYHDEHVYAIRKDQLEL